MAEDLTGHAKSLWRSVDRRDIARSWTAAIPQLVVALSAVQAIGARDADKYVDDALTGQDIDPSRDANVNPDGFTGVASDGRALDSLLYQPVPATLVAIQSGVSEAQALATGWAALEMMLQTQVADSFRASASVAGKTRPQVTMYVRMVVPPACSRCAILAGDYSAKTAFDRHPRCKCVAIPSRESRAEDLVKEAVVDPKAYFNSLSKSEQDRVFTVSGAQAIRDGADIGRVVNARRTANGMKPAQPGGRGRLTADENGLFTASALARKKEVRLMPESIYAIAGNDRELALRLLRQHRFIT